MKFSRNSLIVMLVLLVGAGIALLTDKEGSPTDDDLVGQPLVSRESLAQLQSIEISGVDGVLKLKKLESGQWLIDSEKAFPADAVKILDFTDKISSSKITRLVSRKADRWESLQLKDDHYVQLSFKGEKNKKFYLGKTNSAGEQFVAFEAYKPLSYSMDPRLPAYTSETQWELKTILNIEPDDVQNIELKPLEGPALVFSRPAIDSELRLEGLGDTESIKANVLDKLLASFANLNYAERLKRDGSNDLKALAETFVTNQKKDKYKLEIFSQIKKAKDKKDKDEVKHFIKISLVDSENSTAKTEFSQYIAPWLYRVDSYKIENLIEQSKSDFIESKENSEKKG